MAEIDSYISLFNKNLARIQHQLDSHPDHSTIQFLTHLRATILDSVLLEKGLEICHFADIHNFCAPPKDWKLSDKDWRLGLFLKKDERMLFRAEVIRDYGGNPRVRILHPELITLCPEHYPQFDVKTSTEQGKDGWHQTMLSGITQINGILHPIANFEIVIDNPQIRKYPEFIYPHFGFIPL